MTEAGAVTGRGGKGAAAGVARGLWKTFTHPVTFVVLSLLWCLDLAAGSITAYRADPNFSTRMDAYPFRLWLQEVGSRTLPHSLWVYILVLLSYLLVLSLLLCTVNWFIRRRNRLRGLGEVLVHLGFLFLFGGFVLGSTLGSRTQGVAVPVGASVKIAGSDLALRLDELRLRRDAQGRPRERVSDITLLQGGREAARGEVRLNHPMIHGSTVVYPRDTAMRVVGAELSVAGGAPVRLAGGGALDLEGGRRLRAAALLQEGEGRGSMKGPGIFLTLRGGGGDHLGSAYLSPGGGGRRNAVLGGVRLQLVRLAGEPVGLYDVHRDPGVWLVIIGTVVLGMGTLWSLAGYLGLLPSPARE